MYIKNLLVKRSYRVLLVLLGQIGIVMQFAIAEQISRVGMMACYYTILSNIVCVLYFAYLLIVERKHENAALSGGMAICVMITNLGYHFLLTGAMEAGVGSVAEVTPFHYVANSLVHYVIPFMALGDYLLFTPKGEIKWSYPLFWILPPLVYAIFVFIRAEVSDTLFAGFSGFSRYPYPFVDVDLLGWRGVMLALAALFALTIALGYVLMGLDRWMKHLADKHEAKEAEYKKLQRVVIADEPAKKNSAKNTKKK